MFKEKNLKVTLVAINYKCATVGEFDSKLKEKNILSKYNLELQDINIANADNIPLPVMDGLISLLPCTYQSKDTTVKVVYAQREFKLSIEKLNLTNDNFEEFKRLSGEILDLKLSDISAIGINYSAEYNLGKSKLMLLNNDIVNKVPDFAKNRTFELVLPLCYENRGMVATYRIKKIKGGDNTKEERIYSIKANYHYDISRMTTNEKIQQIENILSFNLCHEFLDNGQKFLELNDVVN